MSRIARLKPKSSLPLLSRDAVVIEQIDFRRNLWYRFKRICFIPIDELLIGQCVSLHTFDLETTTVFKLFYFILVYVITEPDTPRFEFALSVVCQLNFNKDKSGFAERFRFRRYI